ncbi:glyoxylase-like metal-dependent hydrolase (beta-lactamase superfamily II) [Inhella inkyongensis]|uniref:Glyoxylase-like metal-dependent hydrolase (Beta-lactamase superfamily II) n=1 Tax=Inhella inkyongensis TaxID=392593 RepID=A0A840S0J5_9BURK|nr:MBL fold metallo-hydrolase [Inhella inkyongensis]MBB5202908.1 glyoxylase-like metal-dependent hydrolase (beta-lactamase superfamily II) [Inhella inkyongensis]
MKRLALAALLATSFLAQAAPPQAGGQAPGWFRMKLGSFEVTALNDGIFKLPVDKLLQTPDPTLVARRLQHHYLGLPLDTSVNAYLVHTGEKLVLIDTGYNNTNASIGLMLTHLRASGYQPEQVDEVYITHFHGDHINGLTDKDGKAVFPNAIVRADQRESGFWLGDEAAAPEGARGGMANAKRVMKPYLEAGRFKPFDGATELVKGLRAVPTYGHTPGHTIYVAESGADKMVFWGDLMHVAAVQFAHPEVTIQFDSDPKTAYPQRDAQYKDAAKGGYYVGVTHISFPGIGKLRADGKAYEWLPVNYSRP